MPERLGRALATAVPQTIQNIRGIEDIRASETERRAQDFAIKEEEAKSARDNQLISVDAISEGMEHATKGQKEFFNNKAKAQGIINEHGGVRRADLKDFLTGFTKEDKVESNTIGLGDVNTNLKSIEEQLSTGQIQEGDKTRNINEKEMQGLQQQKQQLLGQQQKYINVLSALGVKEEKPQGLTSPIGKLIQDRQLLIDKGADINSPEVKNINAAIQKSITPSGTTLTVDSEGNISFTQGVGAGLAKRTVGDIEKNIIAGDQNVLELQEMNRLFDRSFLEFKGAGIAEAQKFADKLGLPGLTGTKFLKERSKFISQSKKFSNAYRKWVTGVAGGEKEFKEILKAIPDIETNSPDQFKANLEQTLSWQKKVNNWLKHTREKGISLADTPEQIIPTLDEFLIKARASNPDSSDEELTNFYNEKYGVK